MKKSLLVLLATGTLGTLIALAADPPVPARGGPPGGLGAAGPGAGGNPQGPGRVAMPPLDDQQRQLFQQALQKEGDKLRGLEEKLRAAQKEVLQVTLTVPFDEEAVRAKAEAMAGLEVEIMLVRAGALASAARTMNSEQKQQLADSPFGIALLNAGSPGGGPGGGPGAGMVMGGPGAFAMGVPGDFQGPGRGLMAGLDGPQQRLFQEALQKDSDKLRGLEEKLRVAQKDLLGATLDVTFDEPAVRTKADAVAKLQVEITMLRAGALAAVAPSMKPDQKQQLTDSPLGLALLNGGGSGGPGGGGPRRVFFGGGPGGFPGGPPGGPAMGPGNPPGGAFPANGPDPRPRDR